MRHRFCREIIGVVLLMLLGCTPHPGSSSIPARPTDQAREALRRAAVWLRDQQADDGGWHSLQYGILKSGQCYTPYVLDALLQVPRELWDGQPPDFAAAIDFIRRHASDDGVIGMADPDVLEYPNYATAYAVPCLLSSGTADDRAIASKALRYLAAEQYAEQRGFASDSPAYGGWGFGGTHPPGETGHMDLAHTRRVLEALAHSPVDGSDAHAELFTRARRFLAVVQKMPETTSLQPWPPEARPRKGFAESLPYDGGFYFSPIVLAANKGRLAPVTETNLPSYRSYATATCDGLLALLAAGVPKDDPRVVDAKRWLFDHPRLEHPDGIPEDHPEPWAAALHFYHVAVRSEVYAAVGGPLGWQDEIVRLLAKEQREDGSFRNDESPLMKEDDSLMATTLAVTALTHALLGE